MSTWPSAWLVAHRDWRAGLFPYFGTAGQCHNVAALLPERPRWLH